MLSVNLKRVMIIAGESSGELYGAFLAGTLKKHNPEISIIGVGGDRMQAAGVELVSRISSSFGIIEAIKTYGEIKKTFQKVVAALKSFRPQALVLIDYPEFNIKVAGEAKELGIKVLYYVSPQVWAWRSGRVRVIGRVVDKMAVVLPFESEIYSKANIPCEFVGHPVLDEFEEILQGMGFSILDIGSQDLKSKARKELGLMPDKPVIAFMPGSRYHEVTKLLPVMYNVTTSVKKLYPDYQFAIPIAPNLEKSLFAGYSLMENCHLIKGESAKALMASDFAVIASGTSTLQAALLKVPMVIVYKLSPLSYFIGRLVVKVKYISLVNILLEKSVKDDSGLRIKELLQDDENEEKIMAELTKIIDGSKYRDGMIQQLEKVKNMFITERASLKVAEMVEKLGVQGNV